MYISDDRKDAKYDKRAVIGKVFKERKDKVLPLLKIVSLEKLVLSFLAWEKNCMMAEIWTVFYTDV
jgi:hypothetical protein